jgi:thioredoxin reductase (NADPH)
MAHYDCLIIGGGPAGLTAGLYACRAGLKTALLEGMFPGGQITTTNMLENYPGFPDGIGGPDFGALLEKQATRFGLQILYDQAEHIDLDGDIKTIKTSSGEHTARAVILCMGGEPRRLGLPREDDLRGRGVSYCATCDGAFFKDKTVAVVGGGDTACEEGAYLSRMAAKVYLIHRRSELRASAVVAQRVKTDEHVEILWDSVVGSIAGDTEVTGLSVKNVKSGETRDVRLDGLFIAIGVIPRSEIVKGKVDMTEDGHIKTDRHMRTNVSGVYAAGDVRDTALRQVVTSAADGAIAADAVSQYLMKS